MNDTSLKSFNIHLAERIIEKHFIPLILKTSFQKFQEGSSVRIVRLTHHFPYHGWPEDEDYGCEFYTIEFTYEPPVETSPFPLYPLEIKVTFDMGIELTCGLLTDHIIITSDDFPEIEECFSVIDIDQNRKKSFRHEQGEK